MSARHLARLVRLEAVSLAGTSTSDAGLWTLSGHPGLKWVNVRRTRVTAAGPGQLQKALPSIRGGHEFEDLKSELTDIAKACLTIYLQPAETLPDAVAIAMSVFPEFVATYR